MGKYNPTELLILSNFFEDRALFVLAAVTDISSTPLAKALEDLLGREAISRDEWRSWYDANQTVLGRLINRYWNSDYPNIYAEVSYEPDYGPTYAYITHSSALPDPNFDEKSQALLKGTGSIPTLYLHLGKNEYGMHREPLSANIAQDAWLYEATQKLFGGGRVAFHDYLMANKSAIDKLRRQFGTVHPKCLGGGADGVVFDIGDGRVLKIFRDAISFEKAKLAVERLHKNPALARTEAMIYDVGQLGNWGADQEAGIKGASVYYYIMQMMRPLFNYNMDTAYVRDILVFVSGKINQSKESKWRQLKQLIHEPDKATMIKEALREAAKIWANEYKNSHQSEVDLIKSTLELKPDWLELYIEEILMKYLTGRTDLHMGNVGVTSNGELRYYDPAYGGHESEINT